MCQSSHAQHHSLNLGPRAVPASKTHLSSALSLPHSERPLSSCLLLLPGRLSHPRLPLGAWISPVRTTPRMLAAENGCNRACERPTGLPRHLPPARPSGLTGGDGRNAPNTPDRHTVRAASAVSDLPRTSPMSVCPVRTRSTIQPAKRVSTAQGSVDSFALHRWATLVSPAAKGLEAR